MKKILMGTVLCTWLGGCGGGSQPPLVTEEVKLPPPPAAATASPGRSGTPGASPSASAMAVADVNWKLFKSDDFEVLLPAEPVLNKEKNRIEVTSRLDKDHLLLIEEEESPQGSDPFTEELAAKRIASLEKGGGKVTGHKIMKTQSGKSALDIAMLSPKEEEIEVLSLISGGRIYVLSSLRAKGSAPFEDIKTKFAGSFKINEPKGSATPTAEHPLPSPSKGILDSPATSPSAPAVSVSKTPTAP